MTLDKEDYNVERQGQSEEGPLLRMLNMGHSFPLIITDLQMFNGNVQSTVWQ